MAGDASHRFPMLVPHVDSLRPPSTARREHIIAADQPSAGGVVLQRLRGAIGGAVVGDPQLVVLKVCTKIDRIVASMNATPL